MGENDDSNSLNDDTMSVDIQSTVSLNFEVQMQLDKLKKQNQNLKMKLSDTEENNAKLKAQNERLGIEVKELYDDLEIEKKAKKASVNNSKTSETILKLENVERELEQLKFDHNSEIKKNQILQKEISSIRAKHNEEKEELNEKVDNLLSKVRTLEQVESVNAMYKKKLEETADFKNRLRELEEQNESLLSQIDGTLVILYF